MGTFAEAAIVDYLSSFAGPRKTSFRFSYPFEASKRKFAVSVIHFQQTKVQ
jgi:hypothetical protein